MSVEEQYQSVSKDVARVCQQAGRNPEEVTLVAVSKTVGIPEVEQAVAAGAQNFGENRPDQLELKHDALPQLNWHFIGNIQSRRIKDIVGRAVLIHSLYEKHHAEKIDEVARENNLVQDVLIEVNVSGEESKSGVTPEDAAELLAFCEQLPNVRVCGLMTMAPRNDEAATRAAFRGLTVLFNQLRATLSNEQAAHFKHLSMGMSEDWPIAIEEGATIVRIGRAIFSDTFA